MNCAQGFYWLYVTINHDDRASVLELRANTLNALNPNGAALYNMVDFLDVLAILERTHSDGGLYASGRARP